ncbi:MAG: hypothetical protein WC325_13820 [Candidatus Bathyarchaeia archaeon]|jgi:hypothetical protein
MKRINPINSIKNKLKSWWNFQAIIVPDGKNKLIIDLADSEKASYIGKIISQPEQHVISPKGNSPFSVTLPEISKEVMGEDGYTEVVPMHLDNGNGIVLILQKPACRRALRK